MNNRLKRRKRSNDDIFEYYESKRTKMNKPNHHREMTRAVYSMKTQSKLGSKSRNVPKRREKFTYRTSQRRPLPDEFEASDYGASEVDDLANDDFFYKQLQNNRPTTESSDEVEEVHQIRPNVNRDVDFVHGRINKDKGRGKQRQQMVNHHNFRHPQFTQIKDDTYNDYGEMEMSDADVEMHDTFDQNTKEGFMQVDLDDNLNHQPIKPTNIDQSHFVSHQRRKCRKKRPKTINIRPSVSTNPNIKLKVRDDTTIQSNDPTNEQQFEQIRITKELNTPDELHAEIDKIFQMKNSNYNKHGHHRSHWELHIMPIRYKTHEELGL